MLERQLASLSGAALVVVVDNLSAQPTADGLRRLVKGEQVLIAGNSNRGLAAGLNNGARIALERLPECEYLLFLDQDTEPGEGGADRLVQSAARLRASDGRAALVGPLMVDVNSGLSHGIHRIRGWRWTRVFPGEHETQPVRCASINGSGMVVCTDVFRALGGFDESFFIDHVDSEYSFRAMGAGHHLYVLPGVRFAHRMGLRSIRFWLGGWRVWPYRVPERHFYLFRNARRLIGRSYVPSVWKRWAVTKLVLTAAVHAVVGPDRAAQLRAMWCGWRAGSGKGQAE